MPTVGSVADVTLVIWPFDHDPPHLRAYQGTPNSPTARMSRFEIVFGEESEAVDYAAGAGELWADVPGALGWLES